MKETPQMYEGKFVDVELIKLRLPKQDNLLVVPYREKLNLAFHKMLQLQIKTSN